MRSSVFGLTFSVCHILDFKGAAVVWDRGWLVQSKVLALVFGPQFIPSTGDWGHVALNLTVLGVWSCF